MEWGNGVFVARLSAVELYGVSMLRAWWKCCKAIRKDACDAACVNVVSVRDVVWFMNGEVAALFCSLLD